MIIFQIKKNCENKSLNMNQYGFHKVTYFLDINILGCEINSNIVSYFILPLEADFCTFGHNRIPWDSFLHFQEGNL